LSAEAQGLERGLARLNRLEAAAARAALTRCCGSARWVEAMVAARPFATVSALHQAAAQQWAQAGSDDLLEAFRHHPRIGDLASLRERFASTAAWAGGEQQGAAGADEETLQQLARGNADYQARFGFLFIVCATGKSAAEMLGLLRTRLRNAPAEELRTAAAEQAKITGLRLGKLLAALAEESLAPEAP
jgi:2-oxo-4-hydroxy-4-carboxy-5-ureidoimidazoline decarboxylase